MEEYDKEMRTYYDLREPGKRADSFSNQVVTRLNQRIPKRQEILNVIRKQGFDLKIR